MGIHFDFAEQSIMQELVRIWKRSIWENEPHYMVKHKCKATQNSISIGLYNDNSQLENDCAMAQQSVSYWPNSGWEH